MYNQGDLKNEIYEIENSDFQKIKYKKGNQPFKLKPDLWLLANLSGNYGALFIRAVLHELNIDEYYVLKWRLENKFKQYLILNYYIPGCQPQTFGLCEFLCQNDGMNKIKTLFDNGYFLKATLGDSSFSTQSWDKTMEFDQISSLPNICNGHYENYVLQKKLHIKCEFRLHTFSKDIIPGLSYIIAGETPFNNREGVDFFLNGIIQKLPDTILNGTLIGWDIALTHDNQYYIIEGNFTGFHSEYRAGFQTTGYVDDQYYGSIICAWLNAFFKSKFGIYIDTVEESLFINYSFYRSFIYYTSIFQNKHIELVKNKAKKKPFTVIIYLGEDNNMLIVSLIKHFLLVDFANRYHIIVKDDSRIKVINLFDHNEDIRLWNESWLFTENQYQLIRQLGYERRKQICCYHVLRINKSGIII